MLFLLRKIRRKLMEKNKFTTYLLYAIGEVFLVVIGILIAVSINNWNQRRISHTNEKRIYSNIIDDLKIDSVAFHRMMWLSRLHQQTYYHIYYEMIGERAYEDSIEYDLIAITKTFRPTTRQNHLKTIEKIQSNEVRKLLNDYFSREYRAQEAVNDFNLIVKEVARPFINQHNLLNLGVVFHSDMYEFFPKEGSLINYERLKTMYPMQEFNPLLSSLRLGIGYFMYELELLKVENAKLIKELELKVPLEK